MLARLRGLLMGFVTALDDIVVERFWPLVRRGEYRAAFQVWGRIITGWWGCAVILLAALVGIVVVAVR